MCAPEEGWSEGGAGQPLPQLLHAAADGGGSGGEEEQTERELLREISQLRVQARRRTLEAGAGGFVSPGSEASALQSFLVSPACGGASVGAQPAAEGAAGGLNAAAAAAAGAGGAGGAGGGGRARAESRSGAPASDPVLLEPPDDGAAARCLRRRSGGEVSPALTAAVHAPGRAHYPPPFSASASSHRLVSASSDPVIVDPATAAVMNFLHRCDGRETGTLSPPCATEWPHAGAAGEDAGGGSAGGDALDVAAGSAAADCAAAAAAGGSGSELLPPPASAAFGCSHFLLPHPVMQFVPAPPSPEFPPPPPSPAPGPAPAVGAAAPAVRAAAGAPAPLARLLLPPAGADFPSAAAERPLHSVRTLQSQDERTSSPSGGPQRSPRAADEGATPRRRLVSADSVTSAATAAAAAGGGGGSGGAADGGGSGGAADGGSGGAADGGGSAFGSGASGPGASGPGTAPPPLRRTARSPSSAWEHFAASLRAMGVLADGFKPSASYFDKRHDTRTVVSDSLISRIVTDQVRRAGGYIKFEPSVEVSLASCAESDIVDAVRILTDVLGLRDQFIETYPERESLAIFPSPYACVDASVLKNCLNGSTEPVFDPAAVKPLPRCDALIRMEDGVFQVYWGLGAGGGANAAGGAAGGGAGGAGDGGIAGGGAGDAGVAGGGGGGPKGTSNAGAADGAGSGDADPAFVNGVGPGDAGFGDAGLAGAAAASAGDSVACVRQQIHLPEFRVDPNAEAAAPTAASDVAVAGGAGGAGFESGVPTYRGQPLLTALLQRPIPTVADFLNALRDVMAAVQNPACKSFTFRRLEYLRQRFDLHKMFNAPAEQQETQANKHRDFYNVRKVDTHVHHSACMHQKHLLRFIRKKYRMEPNTVVAKTSDGEPVTLHEIFEKEVGITAYDASTDLLNVHALGSCFHRFDIFNSKYNPFGQALLREVFLKTDNILQGRYLAELTQEVEANLADGKYQFVEWRLSIYGKRHDEWEKLSKWVKTNKLACRQVRWMIQVPRLYHVYHKLGLIKSFGDLLRNIFQPIFEAVIDPENNPEIFEFLLQLNGWDSVDDESVVSKYTTEGGALPLPDEWTESTNPPYSYWCYYLYANIRSLNTLLHARGLRPTPFRPHCGEAGSISHLATAFLLANGINHGIMLKKTPVLQYLFYQRQIGLAVSPLSNNALFHDISKSPFNRFFEIGLNVSLSTDDPLMFHFTTEPLLEEYSCCAHTWKFSSVDLCELARNSVLQSHFEPQLKRHWLGENYLFPGRRGNSIQHTNLSQIRVQHRHDTHVAELKYLKDVLQLQQAVEDLATTYPRLPSQA